MSTNLILKQKVTNTTLLAEAISKDIEKMIQNMKNISSEECSIHNRNTKSFEELVQFKNETTDKVSDSPFSCKDKEFYKPLISKVESHDGDISIEPDCTVRVLPFKVKKSPKIIHILQPVCETGDLCK